MSKDRNDTIRGEGGFPDPTCGLGEMKGQAQAATGVVQSRCSCLSSLRKAGVGGKAKSSVDANSYPERAHFFPAASEEHRPEGDQIVELPVVTPHATLPGEIRSGCGIGG
jgi:hypothetical protein